MFRHSFIVTNNSPFTEKRYITELKSFVKTKKIPHAERNINEGFIGLTKQEFRRTDFGSRLLAAEGGGGEDRCGVCLK